MTTSIRFKLKKNDDQTNIDKYRHRVAANIIEYLIYIKINLLSNNLGNYHTKFEIDRTISTCIN